MNGTYSPNGPDASCGKSGYRERSGTARGLPNCTSRASRAAMIDRRCFPTSMGTFVLVVQVMQILVRSAFCVFEPLGRTVILAEIERTWLSRVAVIDLGVDGDVTDTDRRSPARRSSRAARGARSLARPTPRSRAMILRGSPFMLVSLLDIRLQERELGPVAKRRRSRPGIAP